MDITSAERICQSCGTRASIVRVQALRAEEDSVADARSGYILDLADGDTCHLGDSSYDAK